MKRTLRLTTLVAVAAGLAFASCQKEESNSTAGNGSNNGQVPDGYVDLGLPSGLLWATCNLGATTPEEYGDYYAWGETTTKDVYNWSTYKYCTVDADGNMQTLTKYNTSTNYGTPDHLITLQAMDDVATQVLGNGARIPTSEEWEELINNTTDEWMTMNGVNGRKFTAANGNSLFLPAAGVYYYYMSGICNAGSCLEYWSSSLCETHSNAALSYWASSSSHYGVGFDSRSNGKPVRPVRSARAN